MDDPEHQARRSLREMARLANLAVEQLPAQIAAAAQLAIDCLSAGGTLLICGNGGSAADAQHLAAEVVGRFRRERHGLPAIALNSDSALLTAVANDYGFDAVFARQVEALGRQGDLLILFSTSGRSPNILRAFKAADKFHLRTLVITGVDPDPLLLGADLCIRIPSQETPRIQEMHQAVLHGLCELVEQATDGTLASPH